MPRRNKALELTANENIDSIQDEIDDLALRTTGRVFDDAAARDAFYTANLDTLVQGVTRILLQDGGAGTPVEQIWNGATSPASYDNTNWVALPAGATITGPQVKTLYEGNPNTNALEDIPASILGFLSLESGVVVSTASWQFPPGTIFIGEGTEISASVRALNLRSTITNNRALIQAQVWDTTNGFQEAFIYDDTGSDALTLNSPPGTDNSNTANFTITTTADQLIYQVAIPTNQISQTLAGTLEIRVNASDGPIAFTFDEDVTTDASGIATVNLSNPILVDNAMVLYVTGTLQGMVGVTAGPQFTPNATITRLLVNRVPVATFNQQQVEVTANTTINASNRSTYERQLIVIPSSVASPIAITFEEGLTFDFIDIYNNSDQTVTLTASGTDRIHGELTLEVTQFQGGRIRRIDSTNIGLVFVNVDPGMVDDFVNGASFSENVLTLTRTGTLADIPATMPIATTTEAGAMSAAQALKLDQLTQITPRSDEDIRDVVGATLVAGTNVSIDVDDAANTITINASLTPAGAGPNDLRYGLSQQSDPALVVFSGLTDVASPTDPQTVSTGATTAGDYFHIFSANTHDITTITDTALGNIVYSDPAIPGQANVFTKVSNVRTESSVTYDSYTVGPLNAVASEDYVLRFS